MAGTNGQLKSNGGHVPHDLLREMLGKENVTASWQGMMYQPSPERRLSEESAQKALFDDLAKGNASGALDTLLSAHAYAQALVLASTNGPEMTQKVIGAFLQHTFEPGTLFKAYFASLHGGSPHLGTT